MTECESEDEKRRSLTEAWAQESTIELEPFIHQVGGRSAILVLGDYICKPVNERELAFYESIELYAPQLKPYLPQFNGVISVNFTENYDGYLVITTKSSSLQLDSLPVLNYLGGGKTAGPELTVASGQSSAGAGASSVASPNSPYQKFVTKYRIKLCRPLREIIIESHEQEDVPNDVSHDLESSKRQLESLLLSKNLGPFESSSGYSTAPVVYPHPTVTPANSSSSQTSSSNLSRSRSTSISIPNFEDGNFFSQPDLSSLFDNAFFATEAGQNGFSPNGAAQQPPPHGKHLNTSTTGSASPPTFSRQSSSQLSSPTRKVIYHKSTTKHNPWVLKTFSSLSEFNDSMKEQRFLMLENLVANFEYPCIMDLKMGTRLHDDNATETKKQSHESKVNETTSGALGLRITGIQIYDSALDRFICYNKYYGRKLTPESFRGSLKKFISNGNFVAHNLLDRLIEKLKRLRSVIVELDTFRFYTSSLLLIYEGNACCSQQQTQTQSAASSGSESLEETAGATAPTTTTTTTGCCHSTLDADKLIDVRVIDFAHSTHGHIDSHLTAAAAGESAAPQANDSQQRNHLPARQPQAGDKLPAHDYDEGFVFGLDNLIKIFTMFKNEAN